MQLMSGQPAAAQECTVVGVHRPGLASLGITIALNRQCCHAAESPDNQGRRRLRSSSKVNAGASSPGIAEELQVRRSKRKSRQTVESSDDEGEGQPATKRHLDLQANDKVCIICHCSSIMAWPSWYAVLCLAVRLGFCRGMLQRQSCQSQ